MIRLVRLEIIKCLKRMEFKIALIAILISIIVDFLILCKGYYSQPLSKVMSAYNGTIITNLVRTPLSPIMGVLLPLTVSLIYSDSHLEERRLGILNITAIRVSSRDYIISKAISILVVSFLIVFVPLLFNELLAVIAFPIQGHNNFGLPDYKKLSYVDSGIILNSLQIYKPYTNIFVFILIRSLFACSFALISFGMSFFNKINRYVTILSSFIINTLLMITTDMLSRILPNRTISRALGTNILWGNGYGSLTWLLSVLILYFIVAYILIRRGIKNEFI